MTKKKKKEEDDDENEEQQEGGGEGKEEERRGGGDEEDETITPKKKRKKKKKKQFPERSHQFSSTNCCSCQLNYSLLYAKEDSDKSAKSSRMRKPDFLPSLDVSSLHYTPSSS